MRFLLSIKLKKQKTSERCQFLIVIFVSGKKSKIVLISDIYYVDD